MAEVLTQEQIDKLMEELKEAEEAKEADEATADAKLHTYICKYCKQRAVFKTELYIPILFDIDRGKCSGNKGHRYLLKEYLESMRVKS